jgi:YfiH family protein
MILPLASGVFAPVAPGDRPVCWAVTGRLGGNSVGEFGQANIAPHVGDDHSATSRNLNSLAALVGVKGTDLALMQAAHGSSIARVHGAGTFPGVDSLITGRAEVGLVAMGADCVPLIFCASREGDTPLISAVHCGWKGIVAGVVEATIAELRVRGATHIQSVVGPAICGACYSSAADRRELIRSSTQREVAEAVLRTPGGIDVREGVLIQLMSAGIEPVVVGGCTYENPETLFSYRRENRTGRQGIVVAMCESQVPS